MMILHEYLIVINEVFLTEKLCVLDSYILVGLKNISRVSTSYLAKSATAETFRLTYFSVLSTKEWSGSPIGSCKGILASSSIP
jgi:hypothetical protein